MSKQTLARDKVVKDMADLVAKALKEGKKPWLKPWDTSKCKTGLAHNIVSGKPYRGINQFILGYTSGDIEFASFKQWSELGRKHAISKGEYELVESAKGQPYKKATEYYGVQKGSSAHTVVFFTMIKVKDKDDPEKDKRIPILKWHKVFGRSSTNLPIPKREGGDELPQPEFTMEESKAEAFMHEWLTNESITFSEVGARAFYSYGDDRVNMPIKEAFADGFAYMPTFFHECTHATGHKKRCDREFGMRGDEKYAFEELVAELGASLLCKHFNILPSEALEEGLQNQVSYIASWLKRLESNPKMIIQAGSKAQRAMDYILDTKFDEEEKKDE